MSQSSTDKNSSPRQIGLDALLSETSTEALTQIFDKRTATFLAWRLRIHQANKDDSVNLSSAATAFSHALHRILGSGAYAVERLILRDMYSKSGTSFIPVNGYSFEDHINALRIQIEDFSPPLSTLRSALPQTEEPNQEEDPLRQASSPEVFDGVEFSDLTLGDHTIPLEKLKAILADR